MSDTIEMNNVLNILQTEIKMKLQAKTESSQEFSKKEPLSDKK